METEIHIGLNEKIETSAEASQEGHKGLKIKTLAKAAKFIQSGRKRKKKGLERPSEDLK